MLEFTRGRTVLDKDINALKDQLLTIHQHVEIAMIRVRKALINADCDLAKEIVADDSIINNLCINLETSAYKVIALQQPVTKDLRKIISIIRVIPDIERIGDHVKSIARYIPKMKDLQIQESVDLLCESLILLQERLKEAMDAFVADDVEKARKIAAGDDEIDELSGKITKEVIIEIKEDLEHIKNMSKLLLLGKSVERIGDYIVNICETTLFLATGNLVELS